jgi:hypothetical protein
MEQRSSSAEMMIAIGSAAMTATGTDLVGEEDDGGTDILAGWNSGRPGHQDVVVTHTA